MTRTWDVRMKERSRTGSFASVRGEEVEVYWVVSNKLCLSLPLSLSRTLSHTDRLTEYLLLITH